MIYVTEIYDDNGVPVGKVSKCDHGSTWFAWAWREVVVGVVLALVLASQIFVQ
jgi:hypothetical protein